MDDSGCPLIKNFGMANLVAEGLTELELEEYRWNLCYTAPEILSVSGILSKAADVFSFAMVMVYVRRGCLPWTDRLLMFKFSSLPT